MRLVSPLALAIVSALALAACGPADMESRSASAQPSPASAGVIVPAAVEDVAPHVGPSEVVDGWMLNPDGYPPFNTLTPGFKGVQHKGGRITQDTLRGRWTIVAFWGLWSDDSLADARYVNALVSAVKQDRDLHFLSVHTPPGPDRGEEALGNFRSLDSWFSENGGSWPTVMDNDGRIAATFQIDKVPTYLLIGPDLTIEAWRGPLAATPDDGIKSVIRGVAEIKKQIASPG